MNYKCFVDIDSPIDTVVNLWSDESHFDKWQDGFISIEHLSGEPNTAGAKSKILLREGKKSMVLIETLISNDLPKEKKALYEHIHMTNTQLTSFEPISNIKTRYISEVTYIKFNGLLPKLMSKLFPSMFKKQSQKWMNQFKEFVENRS